METKLFTLLFAIIASIGNMLASITIDEIYYNLNDTELTAEVEYCNVKSGRIVIPESIVYDTTTYSVTRIGSRAFYYHTDLTSVTIPNSVTSIGYEAFLGCSGLVCPVYNEHMFAFMPTTYTGAYTIPDGIETIAGGAFLACNGLASITIPNSVKVIGWGAFERCYDLQSVIIGNGVTHIGSGAFMNCSIETIIINSVDTIGIGAFQYAWGNRRNSSFTCYVETPPFTVGADDGWPWGPFDEWTKGTGGINVYVPANSVEAYKNADGWKNQHIYPIGATPTTTDTRIVTIGTADNLALFTWPITENANTYSLQITKDGEVFCTLIFNSNGQLTGIAFAPSRDRSSQMPSATMSVSAMSFTVTGLDAASKYSYRLSVTDEAQNEIQAYSGEFATTGYEGEVNEGGEPEIIDTDGIEEVVNIVNCQSSNRKFMIDGHLFILREGKIFNAQGARVK